MSVSFDSDVEEARVDAPSISKSTFLMGCQCRKLLWFRYNAKDQVPAPDAQQQAIFDQGHEVGQLARQLFPDGIEVGQGIDDFDELLALTQQTLKHRRPLYEAAFAFGGGYARADILVPVGSDQWDLIEVKSTTSVKNIHLQDLAFQTYVLNGAGIKLRKCFLAHIDPDFVRRGPIDPKQFFTLEDVTAQASALSREIEGELDEMFKTIGLRQCPDVPIGPHCDDPYPCPLHDMCWHFLPDMNVMGLYRGGRKRFRLLSKGITALKDIADDFPLTDNQEIQRRTAITGQAHIDKPAVRAFLDRIKYPISFLDFETFGTAIPLFDGLKPYQQVPFQFSLHVQRSKDNEPEHCKFLAEGTGDPRPEFMRRLRDALPVEGSVVAFNAPFELGRLKECCAAMPEFRPWVKKVKRRVIDLLLPFRRFRYYHPEQKGSASMKAVLPALTGQGYDHLAIQDGGMASLEFLRVTYGDVSESERAAVRQQLDEYCGLDTEGMFWIVEELQNLVGLRSKSVLSRSLRGSVKICVQKMGAGDGSSAGSYGQGH